MPVDLVKMLRIQAKHRKQPCGKDSGLSLLCANAADTIEDLDCRLALAESIAYANSDSTSELLTLNKEHVKLKLMLGFYQNAINAIDDRFEYANESIKDRELIHGILGELTENLSRHTVTEVDSESIASQDNSQVIHRES